MYARVGEIIKDDELYVKIFPIVTKKLMFERVEALKIAGESFQKALTDKENMAKLGCIEGRIEGLCSGLFTLAELCVFSDFQEVSFLWTMVLKSVIHHCPALGHKPWLGGRAREMLDKKQLDHIRASGVCLFSLLVELEALNFEDTDIHLFVSLFDTREETILIPLLSDFCPIVLDRLSNSTLSSILLDHIVEALLDTSFLVKGLCLDYLLPRIKSLSDSQSSRLYFLCSEYSPGSRNTWLYLRWGTLLPLVLSISSSTNTVGEVARQRYITNTRQLGKPTSSIDMQCLFLTTAADFLRDRQGQDLLFSPLFGEEFEGVLSRAEQEVSLQLIVCSRAVDLSNKSPEENTLARVLRYFLHPATGTNLLSRLDESVIAQLASLFNLQSNKEFREKLSDCQLVANTITQLQEKSVLPWRCMTSLVGLLESIICGQLFQNNLFAENSSILVDNFKESLHQIHITVLELHHRLSSSAIPSQVAEAGGKLLAHMMLYTPMKETLKRYDDHLEILATANCHTMRNSFLRVFFSALSTLPLEIVKDRFIDHLPVLLEKDKGACNTNYFLSKANILAHLCSLDSEFGKRMLDLLEIMANKHTSSHFHLRLKAVVESLQFHRLSPLTAKDKKQQELLLLHQRVQSKRREFYATPFSSNNSESGCLEISKIEKMSTGARSISKKNKKYFPIPRQALENISSHMSLKSVSKGLILNNNKARLTLKQTSTSSQRLLPEESTPTHTNRGLASSTGPLGKHTSIAINAHVNPQFRHQKHPSCKRHPSTLSRSFVRSLTNPSPTGFDEKTVPSTSLLKESSYDNLPLTLYLPRSLQPIPTSTASANLFEPIYGSQVLAPNMSPPKPMFKVRTVSRLGSKENLIPLQAVATRQSLLPKLVSTPATKLSEQLLQTTSKQTIPSSTALRKITGGPKKQLPLEQQSSLLLRTQKIY